MGPRCPPWKSAENIGVIYVQHGNHQRLLFFFFITLEPRVQWYKSVWASNTGPLRNTVENIGANYTQQGNHQVLHQRDRKGFLERALYP
jgi:hypothetical protein